MSDELVITCSYCEPACVLIRAKAPQGIDVTQWRKQWKASLTGGLNGGPIYSSITCNSCGCAFTLEDDEVPAESGGLVRAKCISKPSIDAISVSVGAAAGGDLVTITGNALDRGNLIVKFGDKRSPGITKRTAKSATLMTPPGRLKLLYSNRSEATFVAGEEIVGKTSGARAALYDANLLLIDNPVGKFCPGETVVGRASGGTAVLGSVPVDGKVDVSVENENGSRGEASILRGGFIYA